MTAPWPAGIPYFMMEQSNRFNRRHFMGLAGAGIALALAPPLFAADHDVSDLSDMTGDVQPIAPAERAARVARAQALMRSAKIDAVMIEPGSSLDYFTGIQWWRSERLTAAILPAEGRAVIVTPFFEEPSIREMLAIDADVRVWQEHENPLDRVAQALNDRKMGGGRIGIEETVRFFASDGLRASMPGITLVSANPVVRACRMIKTAPEIALLQKANSIMLAAIGWTWPRIKEGMTPGDINGLLAAACGKLGGKSDGGLVLLGAAAALPHGSGKPQMVREGEVVLIDAGCAVHGYQSDISRTFVPGKVPDRVRKVWDHVREGQQVALRAAQLGVPCGVVDDKVRAFYETLGYGPGYRLPGLSHRTGHGIGMDGHEPVNLVHGEMTPLATGMCFSNEPGLYFPGAFGVRFEDCFHMTESGPRWFTTPPVSIENPLTV